MTAKEKTKASKFISLVLRHDPSAAGIALDPHGWARIDALLKGMSEKGFQLSREDLVNIVETDEKQRYAIDEAGICIRANQGHSIEVNLELVPCVPPEVLYHGTPAKWADEIRRTGLKKMARQHVHLSANIDTARTVGRRRGEEHIFQIDAAAMHRDGLIFYCSENGVWLTEEVPAKYLKDVEERGDQ